MSKRNTAGQAKSADSKHQRVEPAPADQASDDTRFNYFNGFPTPGPQRPTASHVMNNIFFTSEADWKWLREWAPLDFAVLGSGFCGLAFVETIYNDAKEKAAAEYGKGKWDQLNELEREQVWPLVRRRLPHIVMLERGEFLLPEHFQNLPPTFTRTIPEQIYGTETFPWTNNQASVFQMPDGSASWMHGMVPFVGGRSCLWSGWTPRPLKEKGDLIGWPDEIARTMTPDFFAAAEAAIGTTRTDQIDEPTDPKRVFGELQQLAMQALKPLEGKQGVTRVEFAPLAVKDPYDSRQTFTKFSVTPGLLSILEEDIRYSKQREDRRFWLVTQCVVERLLEQAEANGQRVATAVQTSRGLLPLRVFGRARPAEVVLAVGCLPAATLLLNSFPELWREEGRMKPGDHFGAHTLSSVTARVPLSSWGAQQPQPIELGAFYVGGLSPPENLSYHLDLNIMHDSDPGNPKHQGVARRCCTDTISLSTPAQLATSEKHVVIMANGLMELEVKNNPRNHFRLNNDPDLTTNATLSWEITENDKRNWTNMDQVIGSVVRALSRGGPVEYWQAGGGWGPNPNLTRVPGMVHESSVVMMGLSPADSVVDHRSFRPWGIANVFVTGAGLWPTASSWNPTMTMYGFSQRLAQQRLAERAAPLPNPTCPPPQSPWSGIAHRGRYAKL